MHQTQPSQARGRHESMQGARRDLLGEFSLPGSRFSSSAGVNQMLTRLGLPEQHKSEKIHVQKERPGSARFCTHIFPPQSTQSCYLHFP